MSEETSEAELQKRYDDILEKYPEVKALMDANGDLAKYMTDSGIDVGGLE